MAQQTYLQAVAKHEAERTELSRGVWAEARKQLEEAEAVMGRATHRRAYILGG